MKGFIKANKRQTSLNHIITAMEFLFPNNVKSSESRMFMWKSFGAKVDTAFRFKGFTTANIFDAYKKWMSLNKVSAGNSAIYEDVQYNSVEQLEAHCIKNNRAILTSNDFFYPSNGKMKSLNGGKISGPVFLLEQA